MSFAFVTHRDDILASSTTAKYSLGEIRRISSPRADSTTDTTVDAGRRLVKYVQNTGATALAAGNICSSVDSKFNEVIIAPTSTIKARAVGVALYAMAQNAYGWVQIEGPGEIKAGAAGITTNTPVMVSGAAAGVGVDSTDPDATVAVSIEAGASGALTSCFLQFQH